MRGIEYSQRRESSCAVVLSIAGTVADKAWHSPETERHANKHVQPGGILVLQRNAYMSTRARHTHNLSNVTSQYRSVRHIASPTREGRRLDHGCHFFEMTYVKTLEGGLGSGSEWSRGSCAGPLTSPKRRRKW